MTPAPKVSFEDTAIAFADKSDAELYKTYLLFAAMNNNSMVKMGGGLMKKALNWNLPVKFLIKKSIFEQFCGGETIQECRPTIDRLGRSGIGTILDYSVEGESNEASFDHTVQEIIATIEMAATSSHIPFSVFKVTGVADPALLAKAQTTQELTQAEKAAFSRARARVKAICQRAFERGVRVFIDAEESWMQETIDQLTIEMMELYNQERPIVYNTYQLYRHDRLDVIKRDYERALQNGYYLGGKLVRGAYMEKEGRVAQRKGLNNPINPTKQATDALYDESLRFCLEHIDRIAICAGTHNEQSCYYLMDLMAQFNVAPNDERIYFAQLLGMSDNLSYNLAHAGYNVAKYVPYGPVEAVMPYLLRRADENTAIAGQSSREFSLVKKELARRKR
ncbi:proline dehydrogenase family protein [Rufibacter glacialis]|uniref:Proline dehydrogenase n=1 Tax=Rufibacter glacialis TaxID=1259555 RepID=A0A5M8QIC6_9BACT|nr:proline dehydrogenase family protein [Rufibacter glacialis]KAA6435779.1 proline dehydrogenase [Rufibacter glacialis]GGK66463.1 proline dehydrogenase [Rufibacter glacialis]